MSHIHIPDGVIPVIWWVLGYIICAAAVGLALSRSSGPDARRRVPLLGAVAAFMLIGMSIPLGIIPYHVNFSVLGGILLGPALGFLAAFIANLFVALIGHGGITMVGINSLTVGAEAVFGWLFFRYLRRLIPSLPVAAGISTGLALTVSYCIVLGVIALTGVQPGTMLGELAEKSAAIAPAAGAISLRRFIIVTGPLALPGIIIESFVTAAAVSFIARIKPELLGD